MTARTKIENLEDLIKGKIVGEILEQKLQSLVAPGENFGSVIYKVDFTVKNGEKVDTYHAVAKCTPPNQMTQKIFNTQVTMKAEIGWYTTIIPTILEFQRDHGVEQVADFFQKFYGARISLDPKSDDVDLDAVILTENLIPLGYRNMDRHIGFDLNTSEVILRDLAKFSAVSVAIKLKNKELFDKNIRPYLPGLSHGEDSSSNETDPAKPVIAGLNEIPEIVPYITRIVARLEKNKAQQNLSVKEPWGSICHNDFWVNNIMVMEGNNPKTVFLDFQIASYDTIAFDVLFFLIVSVAQEVIAESMDKLIKLYWDEFAKNLQHYNIDETIFTYDEFLQQIDETGRTVLFRRVFLHIFFIYLDKGHKQFDTSDENFKKEDMNKFNFTLNNKHKEKYKWLVLEFVKRGWL